jgi:hypothetical protein
MEYPGESSSMGSFDTLPSRAGPSGTVEILNIDIKRFSHQMEEGKSVHKKKKIFFVV